MSGIALVDKSSTPQVVWGFSENDLPDDINERFKVLFQTKSKWSVDEIAPYIEYDLSWLCILSRYECYINI